jgi:hypothetical protein
MRKKIFFFTFLLVVQVNLLKEQKLIVNPGRIVIFQNHLSRDQLFHLSRPSNILTGSYPDKKVQPRCSVLASPGRLEI